MFNAVCGEARDVNQSTVDDWKAKLPEIIAGYEPRNIANADETALFFRAIPDKTLSFKGNKCSGGKMPKERLSVLLCFFADGKSEKPLVIGKSKKPRCFKNIDVNALPVHYYHNKAAWMTTSIMEQWLVQFDNRMQAQNRHILLFLDNATSHPHLQLSNIKLVFLPAQTTSVLQPMDQGIIYTTKVYYRKRVLARVCRLMDGVQNVSELNKSVSVLDAIQWLASSVQSVQPKCVIGSYKKAGFVFPTDGLELHGPEIDFGLNQLAGMMPAGVSVDDYIAIDEGIFTENDTIDSNAIMATISGDLENTDSEPESQGSESQSQEHVEPLSTSDMLLSIERIKETALQKGNADLYTKISECLMLVEDDIAKKEMRQTSITTFFKRGKF